MRDRIPRRVAAVALACGVATSLLVPTSGELLAAGPDGGITVVHLSPTPARPPGGPISKIPPDPTPPTRARAKLLFDLKYDHGDPYLVAVRRIELAAPEEAARVMGRFAIELYEGPTLVERVRFDFPMLGPPLEDAGYSSAPRFEPKLVTRIGVFFPALPRGNRLELWDRATDRRWGLPWPPLPPRAPLDGGPEKGPDGG